MKLFYETLDFELTFSDDIINTLYFEDYMGFRRMVAELYEQSLGHSGKWVLSQNNQCLDVKKNLLLLSDYLVLDVNNKAILSRFQSKLVEMANQEISVIAEINENIQKLYSSLALQWPLDITYNEHLSAQDIIKVGNFRFEGDVYNIPHMLLSHIEMAVDVLGVKIIVLVNLAKYLSMSELALFYNSCIGKKINICCIESGQARSSVDNNIEVVYTVDSDWCLI